MEANPDEDFNSQVFAVYSAQDPYLKIFKRTYYCSNNDANHRKSVDLTLCQSMKVLRKNTLDTRKSQLSKLEWLKEMIIKFDAPWKFKWDIVILLIAIGNCIFIPLTLSFTMIDEELNKNKAY